MKKFIFYLAVMFAIVFFASSCNKNDVITSSGLLTNNESNDEPKQNVATWISSNENHAKFWYMKISISIGHNASDCGNKCVKLLGEQGHADCRGFGNICSKIVDVGVEYSSGQNGEGIILTLFDTDVFGETLDFDFPERTFFITNPQNNTDLWLNIPEQLLLRDSIGLPFVIRDIWFSEEPELENK